MAQEPSIASSSLRPASLSSTPSTCTPLKSAGASGGADSTEDFDRGRKFGYYRGLDSFEESVLVSQSEPRVERFRRQANSQWLLSEYAGLDAVLPLESLDCQIRFSEIYDKVRF